MDRHEREALDRYLTTEPDGGFDVETVPVAFNMDLANGSTSKRFCRQVASMFGEETDVDDPTFAEEFVDEEVQDWTDRLGKEGYYAHWSCGDVVVFDLRNLSDDDRESFFEETENW